MVKLAKKYYKNDELKFEYDVNVTKEGLFTTTLPKDVVSKLNSVGIKTGRNKMKNGGFFSANSIKELRCEIKSVVDQYAEKELVDEMIVIRYNMHTHVSYCLGKCGEIYPDGSWQQEVENDYNWQDGFEDRSFNSPRDFGINFSFELRKRITHKLKSGDLRYEYNRISEKDYTSKSTMHWLNSVRGMYVKEDDFLKEVEYTEELGLFFKNLTLNIMNVDSKLKELFKEGVIDISKVSLHDVKLLR